MDSGLLNPVSYSLPASSSRHKAGISLVTRLINLPAEARDTARLAVLMLITYVPIITLAQVRFFQ